MKLSRRKQALVEEILPYVTGYGAAGSMRFILEQIVERHCYGVMDDDLADSFAEAMRRQKAALTYVSCFDYFSPLLSGIQKVEFAVGTFWYDRLTSQVVEVVGQRPEALIVEEEECSRSLYFEHQLYRLEPRKRFVDEPTMRLEVARKPKRK